jgi:hypothetical protein
MKRNMMLSRGMATVTAMAGSRGRRLLIGTAMVAMVAVGITTPAAAQPGPQHGPGSLIPPPVYCGGKPATILGTPGNDTIIGTLGNDVIVSFGGNDTIYALDGDDIICAGAGFDYVRGGVGNDTIYGGADNDWLFGELGDDHLFGQDGADNMDGGPHMLGDRCDGGAPAVGDVAMACESVVNVP